MNARLGCCALLSAIALAGCSDGGDAAAGQGKPTKGTVSSGTTSTPDAPTDSGTTSTPDAPTDSGTTRTPDAPTDSGTTSTPSSPTAAGTTVPESDAELQRKTDEFKEDYQTALIITNDYWTRHWAEFFTGEYRAPTLVNNGGFPDHLAGLYIGREVTLHCGDEVLGPDNAYYCPDGHFLAFDFDFMWRGNGIGDSFVYLIVAHEWGHAVAAHLDRDTVGVAGELVADCLAGASLYGAARDGTLELEEGDVAEITNGLTDIADESPWGKPSDHGDPFDRIRWFDAGRQSGPAACLKTS